jgi:carbonic anhydrase
MRSSRQIFLFLVAGCALCGAQEHGAAAWNHKPDSKIGPRFWADLDSDNKACASGLTQSPIKLPLIGTVPRDARRVVFHYKGQITSEVWNTQHVIEVCARKKPEGSGSDGHECTGMAPKDFYITIPGQTKPFYLKEFHLHAPSEHTTYNGKEHDLEVHLVHVAEDGATAVIGILMDKAGTRPGNPVIKDVMAKAPAIGTRSSEITVNPSLLVKDATAFYSYQGSLTTPPCTQGLSWFVATTPALVSDADVLQLHKVISAFKGYDGYPDNNRRPVMDYLNKREVHLVEKGIGAGK